MKSEAFVQVCSKRKAFLEILQNLLKMFTGVSVIIKMQPECIKSNFYVHIIPDTDAFQ